MTWIYTVLQLSSFWPHVGALEAVSQLPVVWGCPEKQNWGSVPTCCSCDLQHRESSPPGSGRGSSHGEHELHRRWNIWATAPGSARRTFFPKYITLMYYRCCPSQLRSATVFRKENTHQDTNEASDQPVHDKMEIAMKRTTSLLPSQWYRRL